jgi:hypothetical protein
MQSVQIGDKVQFFYNGKSRDGVVQNQWDERGAGSKHRAAGFCLDHGDYYKSYSRNKVSFLAKKS